jgi:hypothetical protein
MIKQTAVALIVSLTVLIGVVHAHTAGSTGYAVVTVYGQTVRYLLTLSADVVRSAVPGPADDFGGLARLVAQHIAVGADDAFCAATPGTVQPPSPTRPTVVVTLDYACATSPRTLSLTDNTFDLFGPDHHTLVTVQWPEGREQLLLEPGNRGARVARAGEAITPEAESTRSSRAAFFRLGVEHILTGYDHLLFLFALLLRGGRLRSLLGIVTAFTIAHSITLALAILGVVVIPPAVVEPVIALSIAYVALENIVREHAASGRWLVSFVFGLVHGFGFAGALLELGLPPGGILSSLLFFNLGVEAGQALVVAALFPALLWFGRFAWERRAVTAISTAVLVAAMALAIERVLFAQA